MQAIGGDGDVRCCGRIFWLMCAVVGCVDGVCTVRGRVLGDVWVAMMRIRGDT